MVSNVWDWNLTSVKLNGETNFFLFSWKSDIDDRLTITQRINTIKTYYKNDDSATATNRDFGVHKLPTTQAIGKIV